ncbi:MAG TPA: regulatory protein RecX [Steroidobacteraceae bacterium]|nr:regulatory protein RecX [Steroidobacteraceae bacterium]
MTLRRAPRSLSRRNKEVEGVADPMAAHAAAIALLARRDLPAGELRERLRARGFGPEAVAAALTLLAEEGAVNDERYVHNYVAHHAGRGQGPIRIAAQLRTLGLPQPLIDAAMEAVADWPALATAARVRRFGAPAPASWREKARQARFLQYRGFSADHIRVATGAAPETD